jgi:4'-phosphopantetheinyl transferase
MWSTQTEAIQLRKNEIHLWRSNLALPTEKIEELALILSTDEQIRANKFRFPKHRNRFIVARATLRKILGNYLQIDPKELLFKYSSRGKPELDNNESEQQIQFNLSHSEDLALYGFTYELQIGVDLEYLRSICDVEKIAQRFFSSREYNIINNSISDQEKQKLFLQIWTGKEAYLKATGEGLGNSLDGISIEIIKDEGVRLSSIKDDAQLAARWKLYSFIPEPNYLASLAVEANNWELSYYDFEP